MEDEVAAVSLDLLCFWNDYSNSRSYPFKQLVIDNGSGMCKAGFAGDDAPRAVSV